MSVRLLTQLNCCLQNSKERDTESETEEKESYQYSPIPLLTH